MIGSEQVREEEGEIVANHLLFFVDPDILAQDADSAGTSKIRFIVGHFAQADVSAYEEIFAQMMRIAQHLQTDGSGSNCTTTKRTHRQSSASKPVRHKKIGPRF